jgi:hypothetical protein
MTLLRQSQIALAEVEVVVFDISIRATADNSRVVGLK